MAAAGWLTAGWLTAGWLAAGGGAACTTTASDEAKARMETKAAVEMAYIV